MKKEHVLLTEIVSTNPFFLHYKGNYKEDLSLKIVDIVENNLLRYYKKHIVNRLVYLVVEAVQNIERYSANNGSSDDFCYIFSNKNIFHVITQNRVLNRDIDGLKARLDLVNSKNHEELKQIYMEVLTAGGQTEKGAGLGLIDMARKTKNNLEYRFKQLNDEFSAYQLHIRIPIIEGLEGEEAEDNSIDLIEKLSQFFSPNKNTLFYSGDFSNTFLKSMLEMITRMKRTDNIPVNSIFKYGLIELNQNIKRHASAFDQKVPGFICLEWQQDKAFISTYNFISDHNAAQLEKRLIRLNASSLETLKEDCIDYMTDFSEHGGLGLIDLVRLNWPNKINYIFDKNPNFGQSIYLKIQFNYV